MTNVKSTLSSEAASGEVEFFLKKVTPFDKDGEPGKVLFKLGNGRKVVCDVSQLSDKMKERLMYHGISQKIGDASSGFTKLKNFQGAFDAMDEVLTGLYHDEWLKGAKERGVNLTDLAEVIAKLKKYKPEDVLTALEGMTTEELKAMAKKPQVAAGLTDLQAARRKAKLLEQAKNEKFEFELKL